MERESQSHQPSIARAIGEQAEEDDGETESGETTAADAAEFGLSESIHAAPIGNNA